MFSIKDKEYTLFTRSGIPVEMGHQMALPPGYRDKSGTSIRGGRAPRGAHDTGSLLTDANELIALSRFGGNYVWVKQ